ncbi:MULTISPECIES: hypothetical protein [unclassified Rathayibacter]|uniref:hypothetical protein n=1 Tax=unclassified Rathayibacter TaxID=2609250 RepID=UPI0011AFD769|nr:MULTISPECIES: hypothetical protein [unclassified Rathayibacter]
MSEPIDPTTTKPPGDPWRSGRFWRMTVALILTIGYAIAAVWFYRECSGIRLYEGGALQSTSLTCAPPDLSSASVLALVLVVVALLWPDLSEIAVLGISLKRRVEAVEAGGEVIRDEVELLRNTVQLQLVQQDASASASTTTSTIIHNYPTPWNAEDSLNLQGVSGSGTGLAPESTGSSKEERSNSDLVVDILREYESLATQAGFNAVRGRGRPSLAEADRRKRETNFVSNHADAIRTVRNLRNAVAHAQEVPRRDLERGIELLEELNTEAAKALPASEGEPEQS